MYTLPELLTGSWASSSQVSPPATSYLVALLAAVNRHEEICKQRKRHLQTLWNMRKFMIKIRGRIVEKLVKINELNFGK